MMTEKAGTVQPDPDTGRETGNQSTTTQAPRKTSGRVAEPTPRQSAHSANNRMTFVFFGVFLVFFFFRFSFVFGPPVAHETIHHQSQTLADENNITTDDSESGEGENGKRKKGWNVPHTHIHIHTYHLKKREEKKEEK
jgi:hypothetical protein